MAPLLLATRGSALALAQSRAVMAACQRLRPDRTFELLVLRTTGDRRQTAAPADAALNLPKGLFTKELEEAMLAGTAALAVHSLKDLPTALPDGLQLGAALPRVDVRDVLIGRGPAPNAGDDPWARLRHGAVVATSSTRRAAQLLAARPDLRVVEIRGNVPTRLRKIAEDSQLDATLLAAAGLLRLGIGADAKGRLVAPPELATPGWGDEVFGTWLSEDQLLPAPAQAAIGIECRVGDGEVLDLCRALEDPDTRLAVEAERAFLEGFGGGCLSPVAALGRVADGGLHFRAVVFHGPACWRGAEHWAPAEAVGRARALGERVRSELVRA